MEVKWKEEKICLMNSYVQRCVCLGNSQKRFKVRLRRCDLEAESCFALSGPGLDPLNVGILNLSLEQELGGQWSRTLIASFCSK